MRAGQVGATVVFGLLALVASAEAREVQGVAARDATQAPAQERLRTGTSALAGTVTAADTGLPIPHAVVTLLSQSGGERRTLLADSRGAFEFADLPAGAYTLRAGGGTSGRYLDAAYGGARAALTAQPIVLKDGERFAEARIPLPRGAAIEGRVLDDGGEPVARVSVYPVHVTGPGGTFRRAAGGVETDDLGRFRLYGLVAGEYIVAAASRGIGLGGMPVTEGPTESFATTYYPSVLAERDAMRIRLDPGAEIVGIQIQLTRTRSFRITGSVIDSRGQPMLRPSLTLVRAETNDAAEGWTYQVEPSGRFAFRNVVAGRYRVVVRPGGPPSPPGTPPPPWEYASVPVHVSADIDDLVVVTSPAVTVTGRVVFAAGAPSKALPMRITVLGADRTTPPGSPSVVAADEEGRFTIENVIGPVRLRPQQVPQNYALEAVRVNGRDITDEPFQFLPSHAGQVEVVLTDRVARLDGTVTDGGEPAGRVVVLLLPDDPALWVPGASRIRIAVPPKGRFAFTVLPGRYLAVAVPPEDLPTGSNFSKEDYEALARHSIAVQLGEGETRTVNLRMLPRR